MRKIALVKQLNPADLMFIAKGYNINYTSFDLVTNSLYGTLLTFHQSIYWSIIILLIAHVAAALKHLFVDKDDVLIRILPFTKK